VESGVHAVKNAVSMLAGESSMKSDVYAVKSVVCMEEEWCAFSERCYDYARAIESCVLAVWNCVHFVESDVRALSMECAQ